MRTDSYFTKAVWAARQMGRAGEIPMARLTTVMAGHALEIIDGYDGENETLRALAAKYAAGTQITKDECLAALNIARHWK